MGASPLQAKYVDRVGSITSDVFYAHYYAANRPVVLEGFLRDWPAARLWSPRYLADRFGSVNVEVMTDLVANPDYHLHQNRQREVKPLQQFVEAVELRPNSGDTYLVAQNKAFQTPELNSLLEDLPFDPAFFEPRGKPEKLSLWMGPANTVTPLHFDLMNILLAQIFGSKRVKLVAPSEAPNLYCHRGGYSQVNPETPDLQSYPLFQRVCVRTVELNAGDALFLPCRWWHHVRSLSLSISVSMSNFRWSNPLETSG